MIKQSPARKRYQNAYRELRRWEGFPIWIRKTDRLSDEQENAWTSYLHSHVSPKAWSNTERFNKFVAIERRLERGHYWIPF